jgi:hypothetical protein
VVLNLLKRVEVVLTEPFLSDRAVVTFHVCVLLWLARLNVHQLNPTLRGPNLKCGADIFRAVIKANGIGLATLSDDLV